MNLSDVLTVITITVMVSGAITSVFMYFDKKRNTMLTEKGTDGDYTLDINNAIVIANKRAADAEKERRDAEVLHKQELASLREEFRIAEEKQKVENIELRHEVAELRAQIASIAYEIKLVAQLGDDPKVEEVTIKRISAK